MCPHCSESYGVRQRDNYKECVACGWIFDYLSSATEMGVIDNVD